MAKEGLDDPQVGSVVKEVAGKGMPEHMGANLRRLQPCLGRDELQLACKMLTGQVTAFAKRRKEQIGRATCRERGTGDWSSDVCSSDLASLKYRHGQGGSGRPAGRLRCEGGGWQRHAGAHGG